MRRVVVGVELDGLESGGYEPGRKVPGGPNLPCIVVGCEEKRGLRSGRGMCRTHYKRLRANGTPHLPTDEDRFFRHVNLLNPAGCWEWSGSIGTDGYGWFRAFDQQGAHRVSWVIHNGPIPDIPGADHRGTCVLHRCDNRKCVNPAHLFLGTHIDNVRDMHAKGRRVYKRASHCRRGHPFSENNTAHVNTPGRHPYRICRACHALRERAYRDGGVVS